MENKRLALRAYTLMALLSPCAASAQHLVVGRVQSSSLQSEISEQVLAEAFQRAGMTLEMRRLPLVRSAEMANDGEIDGNLSRIDDVLRQYPNLTKVPTPINRVSVAIYALSDRVLKASRSDIARLNIGITRGVFVLSKHSRGLNVTATESTGAAFDMLRGGRFDIAMLDYLDAEVEIHDRAIPGIVRWPYAWASEPQYFVLNRKHAALVPRLEAALRTMKAQGLIDKAYADALRRRSFQPLPSEDPPR